LDSYSSASSKKDYRMESKNHKTMKPPRLAEWILRRTVKSVERFAVLGDYEEEFIERIAEDGPKKARVWYWQEALNSIIPFFLNAWRWRLSMISNYMKVALRNIRKYKGYSFINITGLAVGMACFILILLWVQNELSYDKHHEKADRIYRIIYGFDEPIALTPAPMAKVLMETFPEVEYTGRFRDYGTFLVTHKNKRFNESDVFFGDHALYDIFTMPFLKGDPSKALTEPNSIVLTAPTAYKYFGNQDPMGKMLKLDNQDILYKVTGVVEEPPPTSHFHFNVMASLNSLDESRDPFWGNNNFHTYILLKEGVKPSQLERKFPELIRKHVAHQIEELLGYPFEEYIAEGNQWTYRLQPVTDIHLHSHLRFEVEPNGDISYVIIFIVIAMFILVIACINFMNLTTARSANRANEVGIRKVMGANGTALIPQFLSESMLISLFALILAIFIVSATLPAFNNLTAKQIGLHSIWSLKGALLLLGLALTVGLFAGSYPAFLLSSFRPIVVLRGKFSTGSKNSRFRNILVILQFIISMVILVGTFVVYRQLAFMQNSRLGFDKDQILVLRWTYPPEGDKKTFVQATLKHPDIKNMSFATGYPGFPRFSYNTHHLEGAHQSGSVNINLVWADYRFLETLGVKMKSGRYFSEAFSTDTSGIIINEVAARAFGLEDPIGKRLVGGDKYDFNRLIAKAIIGVVEDFHFTSLHQDIGPFMIEFIPDSFFGFALVKINTRNIPGTIDFLKSEFEAYSPGQIFLYSFLDEEFDALYRGEVRTGRLFSVFSVLALVIACLGLFGLISFVAQQRAKEIGVRKVLGASVPQIIVLLCREMMLLVLLSAVIASPMAYFMMKRWLQSFAFQVGISPVLFLATVVFIGLIALVTVGSQAIRAALANPVDSLRDQ